jgi:AcrR family transcriptional regulator
VSEAGLDKQSVRRAARKAENRVEMLDAAELVFGRDGVRDGSLRSIAAEAGFSTAAIYLFFENKQHLLAETLTRRGDELLEVLRQEAQADRPPLEELHRVIDVTIAFFAERPHFRHLLAHLRGGGAIVGTMLDEYAGEAHASFREAMDLLAKLMKNGQAVGEIREGSASKLAYLYSVLLNEYILFASAGDSTLDVLTTEQFHGLVDGALRKPASAMS